MPKRSSRGVSKKNDLDLTPPEEIRARRLRRWIFLGSLTVCVLGVAIYFAAPPVGGAIKAWQSRRIAREAFALIDQKKWSEANGKARDAYLLRPSEPESWRAIARLASRTAQWAAALEWWKKVDDERRLTVEDRRDFVGAAFMAGDVALAAKQVEELLAQPTGPAPIDIVWAGQIAARRSDPVLALDYAERALADKSAKPYDILSAATLVLSVTSPNSEPYSSAWQQIEAVARDSKSPESLDALVFLAREDVLPPTPRIDGDASLSLATGPTSPPNPATQGPAVSPGMSAGAGEGGSPAPGASPGSTSQATSATQSSEKLSLELGATPQAASGGATMSLREVADALENHPEARPYHKLLAIEVRARHDPILMDQYVADAVQRFGNAARLAQVYQEDAQSADETLGALVAWLNKVGRPAKTVEVLPPARALQRQDLFLHYLNALAALQRWNDIKDLLVSEHSVVDPMLQHMYLAVAQAHLGSATGATNEWQRALEVANTSEKALALATYAEQNSVNDIAHAAYSMAIKIVPKNRGAFDGRLRLALSAGQTAQAQIIAAQISQVWPEDANARMQDVYLQLLLGGSPDVAKAAERDAQLLVAKEPRNWLARATLGLARLRLNRPNEALIAIREPRVTGAEPPGALAVRAAILAANGYEDGARNDALLVSAKPLLPEERALIAPLLVERRE